MSGLYSSVTRDIVSFLSKEEPVKGVRVELGEEDTVKVEIGFLALFGHASARSQSRYRTTSRVRSSR